MKHYTPTGTFIHFRPSEPLPPWPGEQEIGGKIDSYLGIVAFMHGLIYGVVLGMFILGWICEYRP